MVRRVKAGELCGTIAGLPGHQETRREGQRSGGGGERLEDSAGTGGVGCGRPEGVSVPRWWGKECRGELLLEEAGQAGLT